LSEVSGEVHKHEYMTQEMASPGKKQVFVVPKPLTAGFGKTSDQEHAHMGTQL